MLRISVLPICLTLTEMYKNNTATESCNFRHMKDVFEHCKRILLDGGKKLCSKRLDGLFVALVRLCYCCCCLVPFAAVGCKGRLWGRREGASY